jgi:phthalate 4,5-dioxygenase
MNSLMKEFWLSAYRSGSIDKDGAGARIWQLGENYVAFRVSDGRVGFFDETCPHRGSSLAIAP